MLSSPGQLGETISTRCSRCKGLGVCHRLQFSFEGAAEDGGQQAIQPGGGFGLQASRIIIATVICVLAEIQTKSLENQPRGGCFQTFPFPMKSAQIAKRRKL